MPNAIQNPFYYHTVDPAKHNLSSIGISKRVLEEHDIAVQTCDLSIELFIEIFTDDFLRGMFQEAQALKHYDYPEVRKMEAKYIQCVDVVIPFLKKQDLQLFKRTRVHRRNTTLV